jgi:hypothetical protein
MGKCRQANTMSVLAVQRIRLVQIENRERTPSTVRFDPGEALTSENGWVH